jgi:8-oxo-dGTP pyrophosphatase MutT (NUDIX family)
MYKIYINEVACYFIDTNELGTIAFAPSEKVLVSAFMGKSKELLNIVDMCEKNSKYDSVVIHYKDKLELISVFESLFVINEAAGGLVRNDENKYLFIFRRGSWDMPKGKLEKGESIEEAAIREVMEETGIRDVVLGDKIITTLHTFKDKKNRRVIKKSHWFEITTINQELVPQTEEDIDLAKWIDIVSFLNECKPVYKNILEVLHAYLIKNN